MREKTPGRWELRVSLGTDTDGHRLTRSRLVKATDAEDARRQLVRWLPTVDDTDPGPGEATVADLLERWFAATRNRRQARSDEEVRGRLDNHLLPGLGHLPLTEVDVGVLERFYARLTAAGMADGTVRHLHYDLRPALRMAVRWGWIERNPADLVDLGPLRRSVVRPPASTDLAALIAAADPALALFIRLYAVTGARRGEIAALRWAKVDLLAGTITIDSALTSPKGGTSVKGTKTARGQRTIGIDFATVAVLEAHRRANIELGAVDHAGAFVFADLRRDLTGRTPYAPGVWSQRFHRLKVRLAMSDIRLHDARHFFATSLLADGVPVTAVSAGLGHGRTSTTLDTYALWASRASDPALAEALARRLKPAESELPEV